MLSQQFWSESDVRGRWEGLLALLAAQPGERMLDVGCGAGIPARYLAGQVGPEGRVAAIDTSSRSLTRLREVTAAQGIPNLDLVRAEASALPFPDGSFDAVLCVNVLEAVPDKAKALREMHRVLKPGGRVLVAHDDWVPT